MTNFPSSWKQNAVRVLFAAGIVFHAVLFSAGGTATAQEDGSNVTPSDPKLLIARDVIMILLERDVREGEIIGLIKKYDLKVIRSAPKLGLIWIKVAARSQKSKPKKPDITAALEPPILRSIRKEPSVATAVIESGVSR